MKIRMNLKSNFKTVPEGERILKITKAECKPSGKPTQINVTFQDVQDGGFVNNRYEFSNDISMFAFGKLLEIALGFEDGDEFDTKTDTQKLIDKTLLCEVKHTQGKQAREDGTLPVFANIKKVISLVSDEGEVNTNTSETSPRNEIIENDEDDLD